MVHVQKPSVTITKQVSASPYVSGAPTNNITDWQSAATFSDTDNSAAIFKVTVTNGSTVDAANIKLTDTFTKATGSTATGSWLGTDPTATAFTVVKGGAQTFYYATTALNTAGTYTNTASVIASSYYDSTPGSTATVTVNQIVPQDLSITKEVYSQPFSGSLTDIINNSSSVWFPGTTSGTPVLSLQKGDSALFKITVTNPDTRDKTQVTLTDKFANGNQTPVNGTWYDASGTKINPPQNITVRGGQQLVFYYVSDPITVTGIYTNNINGGKDGGDSDVVITVDNPAYTVKKEVMDPNTGNWIDSSANPIEVDSGATVHFKITVQNTGTVPVNGLSLTDNFSNGTDTHDITTSNLKRATLNGNDYTVADIKNFSVGIGNTLILYYDIDLTGNYANTWGVSGISGASAPISIAPLKDQLTADQAELGAQDDAPAANGSLYAQYNFALQTLNDYTSSITAQAATTEEVTTASEPSDTTDNTTATDADSSDNNAGEVASDTTEAPAADTSESIAPDSGVTVSDDSTPADNSADVGDGGVSIDQQSYMPSKADSSVSLLGMASSKPSIVLLSADNGVAVGDTTADNGAADPQLTALQAACQSALDAINAKLTEIDSLQSQIDDAQADGTDGNTVAINNAMLANPVIRAATGIDGGALLQAPAAQSAGISAADALISPADIDISLFDAPVAATATLPSNVTWTNTAKIKGPGGNEDDPDVPIVVKPVAGILVQKYVLDSNSQRQKSMNMPYTGGQAKFEIDLTCVGTTSIDVTLSDMFDSSKNITFTSATDNHGNIIPVNGNVITVAGGATVTLVCTVDIAPNTDSTTSREYANIMNISYKDKDGNTVNKSDTAEVVVAAAPVPVNLDVHKDAAVYNSNNTCDDQDWNTSGTLNVTGVDNPRIIYRITVTNPSARSTKFGFSDMITILPDNSTIQVSFGDLVELTASGIVPANDSDMVIGAGQTRTFFYITPVNMPNNSTIKNHMEFTPLDCNNDPSDPPGTADKEVDIDGGTPTPTDYFTVSKQVAQYNPIDSNYGGSGYRYYDSLTNLPHDSRVVYKITVTNITKIGVNFSFTDYFDTTGSNTSVSFYSLIDAATGLTPTDTFIAAGPNTSRTFYYVTTQTLPNNRDSTNPIINKVMVQALDAAGKTVGNIAEDTASATTETYNPTYSITAAKQVAEYNGGALDGNYAYGSSITLSNPNARVIYKITLTNNSQINPVTFRFDDELDGSSVPYTALWEWSSVNGWGHPTDMLLNAGQTRTYYYYTNALQGGRTITNTVTVTPTDPKGGEHDPGSDETTVETAPVPATVYSVNVTKYAALYNPTYGTDYSKYENQSGLFTSTSLNVPANSRVVYKITVQNTSHDSNGVPLPATFSLTDSLDATTGGLNQSITYESMYEASQSGGYTNLNKDNLLGPNETRTFYYVTSNPLPNGRITPPVDNTVTVTPAGGDPTSNTVSVITGTPDPIQALDVTKTAAQYSDSIGNNFAGYKSMFISPLSLPANSRAVFQITIHNPNTVAVQIGFSDTLIIDANNKITIPYSALFEASGNTYVSPQSDTLLGPNETRTFYYVTPQNMLPNGRDSSNPIKNSVSAYPADDNGNQLVPPTTADVSITTDPYNQPPVNLTVEKTVALYQYSNYANNDFKSSLDLTTPNSTVIYRVYVKNNSAYQTSFTFKDTFDKTKDIPYTDFREIADPTAANPSYVPPSNTVLNPGEERTFYYITSVPNNRDSGNAIENTVVITPVNSGSNPGDTMTSTATLTTPTLDPNVNLTITKQAALYNPNSTKFADSSYYTYADTLNAVKDSKVVYKITISNTSDYQTQFRFTDTLTITGSKPSTTNIRLEDQNMYEYVNSNYIHTTDYSVNAHSDRTFFYVTDTLPNDSDINNTATIQAVYDDKSPRGTEDDASVDFRTPYVGPVNIDLNIAKEVAVLSGTNYKDYTTYQSGTLTLDKANMGVVYRITVENTSNLPTKFSFGDNITDGNGHAINLPTLPSSISFGNLLEYVNGQYVNPTDMTLAAAGTPGAIRTFYYPITALPSASDSPTTIVNTAGVQAIDNGNATQGGYKDSSVTVITPKNDIQPVVLTVDKKVAPYTNNTTNYAGLTYADGPLSLPVNSRVIYQITITNTSATAAIIDFKDTFDVNKNGGTQIQLKDCWEYKTTSNPPYFMPTDSIILGKTTRTFYYVTNTLDNGRDEGNPIINDVTVIPRDDNGADIGPGTPAHDSVTVMTAQAPEDKIALDVTKSAAVFNPNNSDYEGYTYTADPYSLNVQAFSRVVYKISVTNTSAYPTRFDLKDTINLDPTPGKETTIPFNSFVEKIGSTYVHTSDMTLNPGQVRTFYYLTDTLPNDRDGSDANHPVITNSVTVTPKKDDGITDRGDSQNSSVIVKTPIVPAVSINLVVTKSVALYNGSTDYENDYRTSDFTADGNTLRTNKLDSRVVYKITIQNKSALDTTFDFTDLININAANPTSIPLTSFIQWINGAYKPVAANDNIILSGQTRTFYYLTGVLPNSRDDSNPITNTVTVTAKASANPVPIIKSVNVVTPAPTPDANQVKLTVKKEVALYTNNTDFAVISNGAYTQPNNILRLTNPNSRVVYRITVTNTSNVATSFLFTDVFTNITQNVSFSDLLEEKDDGSYGPPSDQTLLPAGMPGSSRTFYYLTNTLPNDINSATVGSIDNTVTVIPVDVKQTPTGPAVSSKVSVTTPAGPSADINLTVTKDVAPYQSNNTDFASNAYKSTYVTGTLKTGLDARVVYRITITNNSSSPAKFSFSDTMDAAPQNIDFSMFVEYVNGKYVPANANDTALTAAGTPGSTRIFYYLTGTLPNGRNGSNPITNTVTVRPLNPDGTVSGDKIYNPSVAVSTPDPNTAGVDLRVIKTVAPYNNNSTDFAKYQSFVSGPLTLDSSVSRVVYKITIENLSSIATAFSFTDTFGASPGSIPFSSLIEYKNNSYATVNVNDTVILGGEIRTFFYLTPTLPSGRDSNNPINNKVSVWTLDTNGNQVKEFTSSVDVITAAPVDQTVTLKVSKTVALYSEGMKYSDYSFAPQLDIPSSKPNSRVVYKITIENPSNYTTTFDFSDTFDNIKPITFGAMLEQVGTAPNYSYVDNSSDMTLTPKQIRTFYYVTNILPPDRSASNSIKNILTVTPKSGTPQQATAIVTTPPAGDSQIYLAVDKSVALYTGNLDYRNAYGYSNPNTINDFPLNSRAVYKIHITNNTKMSAIFNFSDVMTSDNGNTTINAVDYRRDLYEYDSVSGKYVHPSDFFIGAAGERTFYYVSDTLSAGYSAGNPITNTVTVTPVADDLTTKLGPEVSSWVSVTTPEPSDTSINLSVTKSVAVYDGSTSFVNYSSWGNDASPITISNANARLVYRITVSNPTDVTTKFDFSDTLTISGGNTTIDYATLYEHKGTDPNTGYVHPSDKVLMPRETRTFYYLTDTLPNETVIKNYAEATAKDDKGNDLGTTGSDEVTNTTPKSEPNNVDLTVKKEVALYKDGTDYRSYNGSFSDTLSVPANSRVIYRITIVNPSQYATKFSFSDTITIPDDPANPDSIAFTSLYEWVNGQYVHPAATDNVLTAAGNVNSTRVFYYITDTLPNGRTSVNPIYNTVTVSASGDHTGAEATSTSTVTTDPLDKPTVNLVVTKQVALYNGTLDYAKYNSPTNLFQNSINITDHNARVIYKITVSNPSNTAVQFYLEDQYNISDPSTQTSIDYYTQMWEQVGTSSNYAHPSDTILTPAGTPGSTRTFYYATNTLPDGRNSGAAPIINTVKAYAVDYPHSDPIPQSAAVTTPDPVTPSFTLQVTKGAAVYKDVNDYANSNYYTYTDSKDGTLPAGLNSRIVYRITVYNPSNSIVTFKFADTMNISPSNVDYSTQLWEQVGSTSQYRNPTDKILFPKETRTFYFVTGTLPNSRGVNQEISNKAEFWALDNAGNTINNSYAYATMLVTTPSPDLTPNLTVQKSAALYDDTLNYQNYQNYTYYPDSLTVPANARVIYKIVVTNPSNEPTRFSFLDQITLDPQYPANITLNMMYELDKNSPTVSYIHPTDNLILPGTANARTFYYITDFLPPDRGASPATTPITNTVLIQKIGDDDKPTGSPAVRSHVDVITLPQNADNINVTVTKQVALYNNSENYNNTSSYNYKDTVQISGQNARLVYRISVYNPSDKAIQFTFQDTMTFTGAVNRTDDIPYASLYEYVSGQRTTDLTDKVLLPGETRYFYYVTGTLPSDSTIVNTVTAQAQKDNGDLDGASDTKDVTVTTPKAPDAVPLTVAKSVALYNSNSGNADNYAAYPATAWTTNGGTLTLSNINQRVVYRIEVSNPGDTPTRFSFGDDINISENIGFTNLVEKTGTAGTSADYTNPSDTRLNAGQTRTFYYVTNTLPNDRGQSTGTQPIVNTVSVQKINDLGEAVDNIMATSTVYVTTPPYDITADLTVTKSVAQYNGSMDYASYEPYFQTSQLDIATPNARVVYKITVTNNSYDTPVQFNLTDNITGVSPSTIDYYSQMREPVIVNGVITAYAKPSDNLLQPRETRTFYYMTNTLPNSATIKNTATVYPYVDASKTNIGITKDASVTVTTPSVITPVISLDVKKEVAQYTNVDNYASYTDWVDTAKYGPLQLDPLNTRAVFKITIYNNSSYIANFALTDIMDFGNGYVVPYTSMWEQYGTQYIHPVDSYLAPNETRYFYYVTDTNALPPNRPVDNPINNKVTVTLKDNNGDLTDNTFTYTASVSTPGTNDAINLSVSKTVADTPYETGKSFTSYNFKNSTVTLPSKSQAVYRIVITNNSNKAGKFVLEDTLSTLPGTAFSLNSCYEWSASTQSFVPVTDNSIGTGNISTRTLYYVSPVLPDGKTTINTATVYSADNNNQKNGGGVSDDVSVIIPAPTNIALNVTKDVIKYAGDDYLNYAPGNLFVTNSGTLTLGTQDMSAGQTVAYRITVKNTSDIPVKINLTDSVNLSPAVNINFTDLYEYNAGGQLVKMTANDTTIAANTTRTFYYHLTNTLPYGRDASNPIKNTVTVYAAGNDGIQRLGPDASASIYVATPFDPSLKATLTVTKDAIASDGRSNYATYADGDFSKTVNLSANNKGVVYRYTIQNIGSVSAHISFGDTLTALTGSTAQTSITWNDLWEKTGPATVGIPTNNLISAGQVRVFYFAYGATGIPAGTTITNSVSVKPQDDNGQQNGDGDNDTADVTTVPHVNLTVVKSVAQFDGSRDFANYASGAYHTGSLALSSIAGNFRAVYKIVVTNSTNMAAKFTLSDVITGAPNEHITFSNLLEYIGGNYYTNLTDDTIGASSVRTFYYLTDFLPDNSAKITNSVTVQATDPTGDPSTSSVDVSTTGIITPPSGQQVLSVTKAAAQYDARTDISSYAFQRGEVQLTDKTTMGVVYRIQITNKSGSSAYINFSDVLYGITGTTSIAWTDLMQASGASYQKVTAADNMLSANQTRTFYYVLMLPTNLDANMAILNTATVYAQKGNADPTPNGPTSSDEVIVVTPSAPVIIDPTAVNLTVTKKVAQYDPYVPEAATKDYATYPYQTDTPSILSLDAYSQVIYQITITNNTNALGRFALDDYINLDTSDIDSPDNHPAFGNEPVTHPGWGQYGNGFCTFYQSDGNGGYVPAAANDTNIAPNDTKTLYYITDMLPGGRNGRDANILSYIINKVTVTSVDKNGVQFPGTTPATDSVSVSTSGGQRMVVGVSNEVAAYTGSNNFSGYDFSANTISIPQNSLGAVYKVTVANTGDVAAKFNVVGNNNTSSSAIALDNFYEWSGSQNRYVKVNPSDNTINAGETRTLYYVADSLPEGKTSSDPITNTVTLSLVDGSNKPISDKNASSAVSVVTSGTVAPSDIKAVQPAVISIPANASSGISNSIIPLTQAASDTSNDMLPLMIALLFAALGVSIIINRKKAANVQHQQ